MKDSRVNKLKKIKDAVWKLETSPLFKYRERNNYYPVIGEGSLFADIMFIGEAPGRQEAETGRPFCGAAGRILDELFESIGIKRKDVYITNIVKDRPPGNRDPCREEIIIYTPFLERQIEIIKPKVIATLGRFSMRFILKKFDLTKKIEVISKNHGKLFKAQAFYGEINIVSLYHPAFAIYKPSNLQILKDDFQILKKFI